MWEFIREEHGGCERVDKKKHEQLRGGTFGVNCEGIYILESNRKLYSSSLKVSHSDEEVDQEGVFQIIL